MAHPWLSGLLAAVVIGAWALLLSYDWRGGLAAGTVTFAVIGVGFSKMGPLRKLELKQREKARQRSGN